MEAKVLKLIAYLGLLALIIWVVASALGRRSEMSKPSGHQNRPQKAQGSVWARKSVPAASSQVAAAAIPTGVVGV
jgi:hypothetical protein